MAAARVPTARAPQTQAGTASEEAAQIPQVNARAIHSRGMKLLLLG
jgi:hypothetical protein